MRFPRGWLLCVFLWLGQEALAMNGQESEWLSEVRLSATAESVELFRVAGSNTLGARLVPRLVAAFLQAEGLQEVNTVPAGENVQVVTGRWPHPLRPLTVQVPVRAHGTQTGFVALAEGTAELAAASRPPRPDEMAVVPDDQVRVVGIDGIAVIVHPANPVQQLSIRQIRDLFSGAVHNWAQVGGPSLPVRLHARDAHSGTRDTFDTLVMQGTSVARAAQLYESNEHLAAAVKAQAGGVGFVPVAAVGEARALAVADAEAPALLPSSLAVATEDYPLSRRLYLFAGPGSQQLPVVEAFLRFVASDAGQQQVAGAGFVAQLPRAVEVDSRDARLQGWQRLNMNVRFREGSSALDRKALDDAGRLADFLAHPARRALRVMLVGYSAEDGRQGLSRLRAQNVRWHLRQQGVTAAVSTLAGDATRVAGGESAFANRNRRVEIWVRSSDVEAGRHGADVAGNLQ